MGNNILLLVFQLFACCVLANPAITPVKEKIGFLPGVLRGDWKKNKRTTVVRQVVTKHTKLVPIPSDDDIISWLQIYRQVFPSSLNALKAANKISNFITTKTFPLSLVNRIQTAFGPSESTPFTQLINPLSPYALSPFIKLSPCAYEKILSLSDYKKVNMGALATIVDYLRDAQKNAMCTSKLRKRLKDFFITHFKIPLRKKDIPTLSKDQILEKPIDDILKILKSPTLFALYSATHVQDFAKHILRNGESDQIFDLLSLNLPSHEMIPLFFTLSPYSYLDEVKWTFGAYKGLIPPLTDEYAVAEHDKNNKYTAKLRTLATFLREFPSSGAYWKVDGAHTFYNTKAIERWKRFYFQRKMDKKSGKVTFLTLEDDYNSVSMGTATPEQTEIFCANAKKFPDQTAQFWNLKFRRSIMIMDALPGVCFEKDSKIKNAIFQLRIAANTNERLKCEVVPLVLRLPEFSWFIASRKLQPFVFEDLFNCGFTLYTLLNINKYIYILEETHQNLAIAISNTFRFPEVLNPSQQPFLPIAQFVKAHRV